MPIMSWLRSGRLRAGPVDGGPNRWLERKIARILIETQARFFTSWVQHQVLKTVLRILAAPASLPYQSGKWMMEKIQDEVEGEQRDEDRVRSQLMELQLRLEIEEIEEEEYDEQEEVLMERLALIRREMRDEEFEPHEAWWRRTFPDAFEESGEDLQLEGR